MRPRVLRLEPSSPMRCAPLVGGPSLRHHSVHLQVRPRRFEHHARRHPERAAFQRATTQSVFQATLELDARYGRRSPQGQRCRIVQVGSRKESHQIAPARSDRSLCRLQVAKDAQVVRRTCIRPVYCEATTAALGAARKAALEYRPGLDPEDCPYASRSEAGHDCAHTILRRIASAAQSCTQRASGPSFGCRGQQALMNGSLQPGTPRVSSVPARPSPSALSKSFQPATPRPDASPIKRSALCTGPPKSECRRHNDWR